MEVAEKVGWDLKSKERLNMVGVDTKVGIKTDLGTKRLRSLISQIKIQDEDKNILYIKRFMYQSRPLLQFTVPL